MKKLLALTMACLMAAALPGGCAAQPAGEEDTAAPDVTEAVQAPDEGQATEEPSEPDAAMLDAAEIQVFIAASLENAFLEIIPLYNETQPDVKVTYNADSSGTLLTQVREGYACDIFFSAAVGQIESLEEEGYMIEGTRADLLCNKVALITWKGSGTEVTGFDNLEAAASMALADGSVPVGEYTRVLLVNLGYLEPVEDVSQITSAEVAEALGLEINECGNVSKVKEAVKEGANEIGTVYYSDAYSVIDYVDVLEIADVSLTGEILYPVCRVQNAEADEAQTAAADDFYAFLQTPEALAIFEKYMFIVNG